MQRSLKLKLQNAVNQISFADTDTPALFVGGRRRNRKKRKNKNGQAKRKNKKGTESEHPFVLTSITPDFEYYQDYVPQRPAITSVETERPVSCLDIGEPMFIYEPEGKTQILITNPDRDSLYCSNESLDSSHSRHDSGCEQEPKSDDDFEIILDQETNADKDTEQDSHKKGFPRTHSRDSGVYDEEDEDVSVVDAGFDEEMADDSTLSDISNEEKVSCSLKDELEQAESSLASTTEFDEDVSQFEEIDLSEDTKETDIKESDEQSEIKIITDINHISHAEHFLKLGDDDDDDDIIFDISQLELNTTEEDISNIGKENFQLKINEGSIFDPTDLEEHTPQRLPMDLLIDDDKDDEVLFDAGTRKELSITCNPLYEQSLKDEEDKLSIKSYQSGFKTNFDNVNHIRIPGTAPNKSQKESSRLLSSQDDDLACCVIL
ncbi:clumping factor B-like isoform X2 [Mercenaria mercenaria]|nr:clumping factor B-like isoform X2 [Mercenaria mercenaria]